MKNRVGAAELEPPEIPTPAISKRISPRIYEDRGILSPAWNHLAQGVGCHGDICNLILWTARLGTP